MRINNNISALNTWRGLSQTDGAMSKSLEKLSSGLRINRAGDDAAGLAISEKMRGQIKGLNQAVRNAQDGISMIQTAEGSLNETHSILQRMRELTVQSNNATNTSADLTEIQKEINELLTEVTRIGTATEFNTKPLLDGTLGVKVADGAAKTALTAAGISVSLNGVKTGSTIALSVVADTSVTATVGGVSQTITKDTKAMKAGDVLNFDKIGVSLNFSSNQNFETFVGANPSIATDQANATLQIGANAGTTLDFHIASMKAADLGKGQTANVVDLTAVNVINKDFADNLKVIDRAITEVSAQRSQLGAYQNRLEHTISNLGVAAENLTAAESRIRDVDMAAEMMNMTKQNILSQAGTAMMAQANQRPQAILQLLR